MFNKRNDNDYTIFKLNKEIETLKLENKTLQAQNEELLNKYNAQREILEQANSIISEYNDGIKEIRQIKANLQNDIDSVMKMKQDYHEQFKNIIKEAKKSN